MKKRNVRLYQKLRLTPDAIIIKLADRIANIEHGGKIDMYAKEYNEFKGALVLNTPDSASDMWAHLDELLNVKELT